MTIFQKITDAFAKKAIKTIRDDGQKQVNKSGSLKPELRQKILDALKDEDITDDQGTGIETATDQDLIDILTYLIEENE